MSVEGYHPQEPKGRRGGDKPGLGAVLGSRHSGDNWASGSAKVQEVQEGSGHFRWRDSLTLDQKQGGLAVGLQ